jgi:hypothetical protein
MAKLVFGMNQSLGGYVDHTAFAPSPTLFRHFIEEAQGQAGSVYGRHMYTACMRSCVTGMTIILNGMQRNTPSRRAWRNQPKWVVSRSLPGGSPCPVFRSGCSGGQLREYRRVVPRPPVARAT